MATRADIRRRVGNMLGDVTPLTATVAGTTTTFIDTITLSTGVEHPKNRDIVITDGHISNVGMVRRITGADLNSGSLTFDALPQATAAYDTAEMYNFRGKGWRVSEYHSAINQAIAESFPMYKFLNSENIAASFAVADQPYNLSGLGFTHMYALQYTNALGTVVSIPKAQGYGRSGWWVQDRKLIVNDTRYTSLLEGETVGIKGYSRPQPVDDEVDAITVPAEWLCFRVASILCMSAVDRDQGNFARAQTFQRQADQCQTSIRTRMPSTTVLISEFE